MIYGLIYVGALVYLIGSLFISHSKVDKYNRECNKTLDKIKTDIDEIREYNKKFREEMNK